MCSDQKQSPRERVQVDRARVAEIRDRTLDDSYTHVRAYATLYISMTTQNGGRSLDVLVALIAAPNKRRRSFFFRFQKAERPKGGSKGAR